MEWVETTGRSIEEAKQAALEQLGVAEEDAELVVVDEPKPGLFGRVRGEARVRARVRPTQPRPKEERRRRRPRAERSAVAADESPGAEEEAIEAAGPEEQDTEDGELEEHEAVPAASTPSRGRGGRRPSRNGDGGPGGDDMDELVPMDRQAEEAMRFVNGLLDNFDLDADVTYEMLSDDMVQLRVTGDDLGLLIGPKGVTLSAVQELTRTVVQRKLRAHNGRILVDVAGYREKRKAALERFTRDLANEVISSGQRRVLEPMSPPDRKVVHDTVNEIDGVTTISEGEEPRRRVVIMPTGR